ncbi:Uncharacterised protein [Sphingomonas paucimobilis]|nr:Uncharacterised protein [Sphingomonas paucimobilis]
MKTGASDNWIVWAMVVTAGKVGMVAKWWRARRVATRGDMARGTPILSRSGYSASVAARIVSISCCDMPNALASPASEAPRLASSRIRPSSTRVV